MNRVGVSREVHCVDPEIGEMSLNPVDPGQVGGEPVLDDNVLAEPGELGRVEERFRLGGHEVPGRGQLQPVLDGHNPAQIIFLVGSVGQTRLGGGLPPHVRVFLEIPFQERTVAEILEPPAAVGHGGLQHLITHRHDYIPGRHAPEHGGVFPVRGGNRLAEIKRRGTVDPDPALT
ncbi:hypothetical protein ES703_79004 [subsurface metagenome]